MNLKSKIEMNKAIENDITTSQKKFRFAKEMFKSARKKEKQITAAHFNRKIQRVK